MSEHGARELAASMAAYQAGELAAFESLYESLAPKLRAYLLSLTWSRQRAEDLLQESFLQLHRSRHTYRRGRPVLPWAFAIARHVFLMDRRAARRKARYETLAPAELPEVPVPAAVEKLAAASLVREALSRLDGDRREAVVLHHVFGLSFAEIGSLLGIRAGTAKLRAHRAIHALRKALGRNDADRADRARGG